MEFRSLGIPRRICSYGGSEDYHSSFCAIDPESYRCSGVTVSSNRCGHVDHLGGGKFVGFIIPRNCEVAFGIEYRANDEEGTKRKRQAEDIEVQRRQIPRSTKWPILSSSSAVLFRLFCDTCRLDQQNSVCPVTLARWVKANG